MADIQEIVAPIDGRHMHLSYPSQCGNPNCERGQLPAGSDVIIANKRIYCGIDCATVHMASSHTRTRKTATRKTAAAATAK
jgi:hypothetical protein